jgi:L-iditol 2-dehydrogenase
LIIEKPVKSSITTHSIMLACLLDGPDNRVSIRDVPVPRLNKGDALVKMEACGICGTDLEKISGQLGPGGILGHEISGTIQHASENSRYRIGDRVVAHHHVPCYKCATCQKRDYTLCEQFKKTNIDPCGLAESFRVPEYNVERGALVELPKQLSFEEGAMIEPTACCIRAIDKTNLHEKDNILVVGLGPTGLTQVQLLRKKTSGQIIGTDVIEARLKIGAKLGADKTLSPQSEKIPDVVVKMTGGGADLALVATGNEKALDQALSSVRRGGKVLLFGAPALGAHYQLDTSTLFSRGLSLITSYSCTEAEIHEAIRLVSEKQLDLQALISHRFKLREADKALEHALSSKTAIKTIVTA